MTNNKSISENNNVNNKYFGLHAGAPPSPPGHFQYVGRENWQMQKKYEFL